MRESPVASEEQIGGCVFRRPQSRPASSRYRFYTAFAEDRCFFRKKIALTFISFFCPVFFSLLFTSRIRTDMVTLLMLSVGNFRLIESRLPPNKFCLSGKSCVRYLTLRIRIDAVMSLVLVPGYIRRSRSKPASWKYHFRICGRPPLPSRKSRVRFLTSSIRADVVT